MQLSAGSVLCWRSATCCLDAVKIKVPGVIWAGSRWSVPDTNNNRVCAFWLALFSVLILFRLPSSLQGMAVALHTQHSCQQSSLQIIVCGLPEIRCVNSSRVSVDGIWRLLASGAASGSIVLLHAAVAIWFDFYSRLDQEADIHMALCSPMTLYCRTTPA